MRLALIAIGAAALLRAPRTDLRPHQPGAGPDPLRHRTRCSGRHGRRKPATSRTDAGGEDSATSCSHTSNAIRAAPNGSREPQRIGSLAAEAGNGWLTIVANDVHNEPFPSACLILTAASQSTPNPRGRPQSGPYAWCTAAAILCPYEASGRQRHGDILPELQPRWRAVVQAAAAVWKPGAGTYNADFRTRGPRRPWATRPTWWCRRMYTFGPRRGADLRPEFTAGVVHAFIENSAHRRCREALEPRHSSAPRTCSGPLPAVPPDQLRDLRLATPLADAEAVELLYAHRRRRANQHHISSAPSATRRTARPCGFPARRAGVPSEAASRSAASGWAEPHADPRQQGRGRSGTDSGLDRPGPPRWTPKRTSTRWWPT